MYSEKDKEETLITYNKINNYDTKICIKHEIDEAEISVNVKAEPYCKEGAKTVLKCESDLYKDHIVKEDCDMVIGPVLIQTPSLRSKQSPISIRDRIIFEEEYDNDIHIDNSSQNDKSTEHDKSPELDIETQKIKPNISKKDKQNSGTLTCDICSKHFTFQCNLYRHIRQIHNRDKCEMDMSYRCKVCDKQFSSKYNLEIHTNIHLKASKRAKYSCNVCGKMFNHPSNCNRHKRLYCAKGNYNRVKSVQKRTPRDKTKFICDICKDGFASRTDIIRHIFAHNNIKPFKCRLCPNKKYSRKAGLNNHILARHNNGIKNYSCTKCDKKYVRSFSLRLHERDVHSN